MESTDFLMQAHSCLPAVVLCEGGRVGGALGGVQDIVVSRPRIQAFAPKLRALAIAAAVDKTAVLKPTVIARRTARIPRGIRRIMEH